MLSMSRKMLANFIEKCNSSGGGVGNGVGSFIGSGGGCGLGCNSGRKKEINGGLSISTTSLFSKTDIDSVATPPPAAAAAAAADDDGGGGAAAAHVTAVAAVDGGSVNSAITATVEEKDKESDNGRKVNDVDDGDGGGDGADDAVVSAAGTAGAVVVADDGGDDGVVIAGSGGGGSSINISSSRSNQNSSSSSSSSSNNSNNGVGNESNDGRRRRRDGGRSGSALKYPQQLWSNFKFYLQQQQQRNGHGRECENEQQSCQNLMVLQPTNISLVAAVSQDGIIGIDNHMPWICPDELTQMRQIIHNGHLFWPGGGPESRYLEQNHHCSNHSCPRRCHNVLLMGRRTFESLGRRTTFLGCDICVVSKTMLAAKSAHQTSSSASSPSSWSTFSLSWWWRWLRRQHHSYNDAHSTNQVSVFATVDDAIRACSTRSVSEIFVFGGTEIFRECMDRGLCYTLFISRMKLNVLPPPLQKNDAEDDSDAKNDSIAHHTNDAKFEKSIGYSAVDPSRPNSNWHRVSTQSNKPPYHIARFPSINLNIYEKVSVPVDTLQFSLEIYTMTADFCLALNHEARLKAKQQQQQQHSIQHKTKNDQQTIKK